jgi:hypothetical protein
MLAETHELHKSRNCEESHNRGIARNRQGIVVSDYFLPSDILHLVLFSRTNPHSACSHPIILCICQCSPCRPSSCQKHLAEDCTTTAFEPLLPHLNHSKERESTHVLMTRTCLMPEAGLFNLLLTLLRTSPLFVTSAAWRLDSNVTELIPHSARFSEVLHNYIIYLLPVSNCIFSSGLIMALIELVPVELIPDFDGLAEIWITLFGRSESNTVDELCPQFWDAGFKRGIARRAILDVARSRFPIHLRPLIRLLHVMTGSGFLDTDPLSTANHGIEGGAPGVRHAMLQLQITWTSYPLIRRSSQRVRVRAQTTKYRNDTACPLLLLA